MRKIVTALIAAAFMAATAITSSGTAQARWGGGGWHGGAGFGGGWRGGGGWHGAGVWRGGPGFGWHGGWRGGFPFAGVAAGLAAAAIFSGALVSPYGYGYYPYGYAVAPGYGYAGYGYGYGGGGGCYLVQQWGPYGPVMAQVCE
jgi:hypothetical protein